jgi:hypothetical protein
MTGTELLITIMDRFREHGEAEDIIVIYTDTGGRVRYKANCNYTRSLGLATWAKADIEDTLNHAEGGTGESG